MSDVRAKLMSCLIKLNPYCFLASRIPPNSWLGLATSDFDVTSPHITAYDVTIVAAANAAAVVIV